MNRFKSVLFQCLKISVAAILSIILATVLHLKNPVTAGIITILSIQGTKRETIKTARNRALAFVIALMISAVCFWLFGFRITGFSVYILLFSLVCLYFGWPEALAMDSVLISHFLLEGNMEGALLINEVLIFIIGTVLGILANLFLRRDSVEFKRLAAVVDESMKGVLFRMSEKIISTDRDDYDGSCFDRIESEIDRAEKCAYANRNNTFSASDDYEISYIEMRRAQADKLKQIYFSIMMIESIPEQAHKVADIICQIRSEYREQNDVSGLLANLKEMFEAMKQEALPWTREEFEARAVLFYILKQLEEFLLLKKKFVEKYRNMGYSLYDNEVLGE